MKHLSLFTISSRAPPMDSKASIPRKSAAKKNGVVKKKAAARKTKGAAAKKTVPKTDNTVPCGDAEKSAPESEADIDAVVPAQGVETTKCDAVDGCVH